MFCFIALLVCLGLFLFHLAALVLFMMSFLLAILTTGDFATAMAAGTVGAITGAAIQAYAKWKF